MAAARAVNCQHIHKEYNIKFRTQRALAVVNNGLNVLRFMHVEEACAGNWDKMAHEIQMGTVLFWEIHSPLE
jgi:hypothetical protein